MTGVEVDGSSVALAVAAGSLLPGCVGVNVVLVQEEKVKSNKLISKKFVLCDIYLHYL